MPPIRIKEVRNFLIHKNITFVLKVKCRQNLKHFFVYRKRKAQKS